MPRLAAVLPLVLAVLLLETRPGAAAPHPCIGTVNAELKRLDADRSDVQTIFFDTRRTKDEQAQFLGYTGWVYFRRCAGPLVFELTPQCGVERTYSTGNCRWRGVPSYR